MIESSYAIAFVQGSARWQASLRGRLLFSVVTLCREVQLQDRGQLLLVLHIILSRSLLQFHQIIISLAHVAGMFCLGVSLLACWFH